MLVIINYLYYGGLNVKKIKTLILVIISMFALNALLNAKVLNVGKGRQFSKIQDAIDKANKGDFIKIYPGTYKIAKALEIVNKEGLYLSGVGKVNIYCSDQGSNVINIRNSKSIVIRNLHMMHYPVVDGCGGYVINARNSPNLVISGCEINGCGMVGINAVECDNLTILKNKIHNNSWTGFYIMKCNNVRMSNNSIYKNQIAGYFKIINGGIISANKVYDNAKPWVKKGNKNLRFHSNEVQKIGGVSDKDPSRILRVGPNKKYKDIQTAIHAAKDGATIRIYSGNYRTKKPVIIEHRKNLKIIGIGNVNVLCSNMYTDVMRIFKSKNILIRNLRMRHYPVVDGCGGAVINARDTEKLTVERCELNGCGMTGIMANNCRDMVVKFNKIFKNSYAGFSFYKCNNLTFSRNRVYNNYKAGSFVRISRGVVTRNKFYNNEKPFTKNRNSMLRIYNNDIKRGGNTQGKDKSRVLHVGRRRKYKTIQSAIDAARNGATIRVHKGIYRTSKPIKIVKRKGLKIIGRGVVRIICTDRNADVMQVFNSQNILIRNIRMKHSPAVTCGGTVLTIDRSNRVRVIRCVLNGCGMIGINASDSNNLVVRRCRMFKNSYQGFYFYNCRNIRFMRNRVYRNYVAGEFRNCTGGVIARNRFYRNKKGVRYLKNRNIRKYGNRPKIKRRKIRERGGR